MDLEELNRILDRQIEWLKSKNGGGSEKHAQAGEMWMMPSEMQRAWGKELSRKQTKEQEDNEEYLTASLTRGVAKGLHGAMPGLADLTGAIAGVLNGLGHGTSSLMSGGEFKDGFNRGFSDSSNFAKRYYSDPIRHAQLFYGGNKVKKELDGWKDFYEQRIRDRIGDPVDGKGNLTEKYRKAISVLDRGKIIEEMANRGTSAAVQWPIVGSLFKAMLPNSLLGTAPSVATTANSVASSAAPVASTTATSAAAGAARTLAGPGRRFFGKAIDVATSPWFALPEQATESGLHELGAAARRIEMDKEKAMARHEKENEEEKYRREMKARSDYWTRMYYSAGISEDERRKALARANYYLNESRRESN